MKGNCKLLPFSLMALAIALVSASIGLGRTQGQVSKAAAQSESMEAKDEDRCLPYSPGRTSAIDACYSKLMAAYACAVQAGEEAEQRAKNRLEQFYRQLHNNTTVGIEKIYNKAKEQGCKEKSPVPEH